MRTITKKVYSFDELSEDAKQKALQDYSIEDTYHWDNEALQSLKKGLEHFNCSLENYSIDYLEPHRNSFRLDLYYDHYGEDELYELIESMGSYNPETLRGNGDCKFTGVCFDEDFADGVRKEYYSGERDLHELMMAGIGTWETAVQRDCEYQFSEEGYKEHCEANEYEFYEDGSMV